ncbi:hypothetical protein OGATHE_001169 [Ogataea polymorpha]|uniref:Uncharacterized protein n=1 Tax=Ogataea polymorpha TaxID=460523 RepID=A0A9P8PSB8_9ASCO|nr:hypothetical protein OGATHE_001169 [Ogataea polymorpha]
MSLDTGSSSVISNSNVSSLEVPAPLLMHGDKGYPISFESFGDELLSSASPFNRYASMSLVAILDRILQLTRSSISWTPSKGRSRSVPLRKTDPTEASVSQNQISSSFSGPSKALVESKETDRSWLMNSE